MSDPLDVVKFVCKEFWDEVFMKKVISFFEFAHCEYYVIKMRFYIRLTNCKQTIVAFSCFQTLNLNGLNDMHQMMRSPRRPQPECYIFHVAFCGEPLRIWAFHLLLWQSSTLCLHVHLILRLNLCRNYSYLSANKILPRDISSQCICLFIYIGNAF